MLWLGAQPQRPSPRSSGLFLGPRPDRARSCQWYLCLRPEEFLQRSRQDVRVVFDVPFTMPDQYLGRSGFYSGQFQYRRKLAIKSITSIIIYAKLSIDDASSFRNFRNPVARYDPETKRLEKIRKALFIGFFLGIEAATKKDDWGRKNDKKKPAVLGPLDR